MGDLNSSLYAFLSHNSWWFNGLKGHIAAKETAMQ